MSFKEYRKKRHHSHHEYENAKIPNMETVFGKHSIELAAEKLASMETRMGQHSIPNGVKEQAEESVYPKKSDTYRKTIGPRRFDDPDHKHQFDVHNLVAEPDHAALTPKEDVELQDYSNYSHHVNDFLHKHRKYGVVSDSMVNKPVDSIIESIHHLDSALSKQKTKHDSVVYTGIPYSPVKHFHSPNRGVKVHLPAFTSTSSDKIVAYGFSKHSNDPFDEDHGVKHDENNGSRHILKIHMPKGTHAMSMVDHAFIPEEHEVLLHRGHTIGIHPKPEYDEKLGAHVWTAKILSHDPEEIKPIIIPPTN